jgi:hypothetical protein
MPGETCLDFSGHFPSNTWKVQDQATILQDVLLLPFYPIDSMISENTSLAY